jgi:hypothetical protein
MPIQLLLGRVNHAIVHFHAHAATLLRHRWPGRGIRTRRPFGQFSSLSSNPAPAVPSASREKSTSSSAAYAHLLREQLIFQLTNTVVLYGQAPASMFWRLRGWRHGAVSCGGGEGVGQGADMASALHGHRRTPEQCRSGTTARTQSSPRDPTRHRARAHPHALPSGSCPSFDPIVLTNEGCSPIMSKRTRTALFYPVAPGAWDLWLALRRVR